MNKVVIVVVVRSFHNALIPHYVETLIPYQECFCISLTFQEATLRLYVALSLSAQIHNYVNNKKLQSKGVDKGAEAHQFLRFTFTLYCCTVLFYMKNPNSCDCVTQIDIFAHVCIHWTRLTVMQFLIVKKVWSLCVWSFSLVSHLHPCPPPLQTYVHPCKSKWEESNSCLTECNGLQQKEEEQDYGGKHSPDNVIFL